MLQLAHRVGAGGGQPAGGGHARLLGLRRRAGGGALYREGRGEHAVAPQRDDGGGEHRQLLLPGAVRGARHPGAIPPAQDAACAAGPHHGAQPHQHLHPHLLHVQEDQRNGKELELYDIGW